MSRLLQVSLWYPLSGALLLGAACSGDPVPRDRGSGFSGDAGALMVDSGSTPAGGSSLGTGGASSGEAGLSDGCHELDQEPNDDRAVAFVRDTFSDCDSDSTIATGTLAGDDADWWQFGVDDSLGCLVNPTVSTDSLLRVCVAASCAGGTFWCEQGELDDFDGCCQLTPGTVELGIECDGTDDSVTVWIGVFQDWTIPISDRDCLDYSVDVHF